MTIRYEARLKQRSYEPVVGYVGEPKYTIIYYDEDKEPVLKAMGKYVKMHGFMMPDGMSIFETIVLYEQTTTGEFIGETPYHKLFDTITGEILPEVKKELKSNG